MLEFRRILDFSSRAHTYVLIMYIFFALMVVLTFYFPVNDALVDFISISQMVLGWTLFLEAIWIIFASVICSFYAKVMVIEPVLLTLLRLFLYFGISMFLDVINTFIVSGFSFGG